MDKQSLITEIRKLVGSAPLDQALEKLIAFLEKNQKEDAHVYRQALQIKAQFEKTQRDESKGIVTFDDAKVSYNQVTDRLLDLLEKWESGTQIDLEVAQKPAWKRWAPIVSILTILLVSALFILPRFRSQTTRANSRACPGFEIGSLFNVMVLPFRPLRGEVLPTHTEILTRLLDLSEKYRIKASIKDLEINPRGKRYPLSNQAASRIADTCNAKLIIWGTTEPRQNGDIIQTRFKFLNLGDQFAFKQIEIAEDAELDTITSLSSIATQGVLTEKIEDNIRLLFGIIANRTNNPMAAIEQLDNADVKDSTKLLWGMVLADSYLGTGNNEKALAAYDEVLEAHPDYWFALNNRAMLYYQQGNYAEALNDLDRELGNSPEKVDALAARGSVFLKIGQLKKAETDLQKARTKDPNNPALERKIETLKTKKAEQIRIKQEAESNLRRSPKNATALLEQAEASSKLGDYQTAVKAARDLLRIDPKNSKAFSILLEAARETESPEKVKQIIREASSRGITKESMMENRPILKTLDMEKQQ